MYKEIRKKLREINGGIEATKRKIEQLLGKSIEMTVSKGRKRTEIYTGKIEGIYPQVFILKLEENSKPGMKKISCSYTDVLCGNVTCKEVLYKAK